MAAIKRGSVWDSVSMFIAMIGVSVPSFILGAVLQYFLGLQLRKTFGINLFPIQGWGKFNQTLLPSFALGLGSLATVSRLMRTSMLDVLGQDYIKTAKSKGLSQGKILWRHALRNAIMPVVTVMGPTVASVLTGTFVIESIFNIPGLGKYFVTSIKDLDYTMIGGTVVFYGGLLIVCTLVVDLLYGFIDPARKTGGLSMEHIEKSRFAHVGQSAQESESIKRPSLTFMQDAMRRLWKNKVAMVCVVIILVLTAMSIFAPMVSKFDYREQHYSHTNAPMGTVCNESGAEGEGHVHYFGTDTLGRDIFTRIWMGRPRVADHRRGQRAG